MTSMASASASPRALSTFSKPAFRATSAVASPTAKIGRSRRSVDVANSRAPKALVSRTAWMPSRSIGPWSVARISSSGSWIGSMSRSLKARAIAPAFSRGRVISARILPPSVRTRPSSKE